MNKNSVLIATAVLAITLTTATAQDHGHLNVGATGTTQNAPLTFDNGPDFASSNNYVKTLSYTSTGTYAGYYQGNVTLTALPATAATGGPAPNAPALGSWIFAQLVAVDGPAGGSFAFWESGATTPTFSLNAGATGTNTFRLTTTTNQPPPDGDPFGHVHGRRFTATVPGIYSVSFRALDKTTNGIGSGPIHTPSEVLTIFFQAGDMIQSVEPLGTETHVRFAARSGYDWQLLSATEPAAPIWSPIGAPVAGDDYFHEVTDPSPVSGNRYYKTVGTPAAP